MIQKVEEIKKYADILRLSLLRKEAESELHQAQIDKPSYIDYTHNLLEKEVLKRQNNDFERRVKMARLLRKHDLDLFDFDFSCGLTKPAMKELRELLWLEQAFNVILMGPSGTGKSYIASGLVHDAVKQGYRAYFTTMEDLVNVLKMKDITSTALATYNRYLKAHLIAIDDVMMLPINQTDGLAFLGMVNHLHEQSSIIITTNKAPKQWAETLDQAVTMALLDRLLYHCQVVKLEGGSYRMANRKTIFASDKGAVDVG